MTYRDIFNEEFKNKVSNEQVAEIIDTFCIFGLKRCDNCIFGTHNIDCDDATEVINFLGSEVIENE